VAAVTRGDKVLLTLMLALIVGLWAAVFIFADWPWI
jgi:hypothetical protein